MTIRSAKMKKFLNASLVLISVLALLLAAGICSYAEETPEPVWRVTHKDGTSEDIYSFTEPFLSATSGDYFKLIPTYYEIKLDTTFRSTADTDYTLDFGSSTVVFTSTENHSPAIAISGATELTMLGDGCTVYLQDQTSAFMSFAGESKLYLDGGKNMFRVLAPDSFEINGSSTAELHNLFVFKHCANMMGGFCVRNTAKATVYDSIFYGEKNRNAVFSDNEGQLTLVNCSVLSLDNSQALAVRGAKATINFEGDCFVYGNAAFLNTTAQNAYIFLHGRLYTNSPSLDTRFSGEAKTAVSLDRQYTLLSFITPNASSAKTLTFKFSKRFGNDSAPSMDIPEGDRVWELKDRGGELLGYLDSFDDLSKNFAEVGSARLLKSISTANSLSLVANGDALIDFGSNDVLLFSHPFIPVAKNALIDISGEGVIELRSFAATFTSVDKSALVRADDWVSLYLNMPESVVAMSSLAHSFRGDINVNSLSAFCSSEDEAMLSTSSGKISITSSTLRSLEAPVAESGTNIYASDSVLASCGDYVVTTKAGLLLDSCPAIIGGVQASTVTCTIGTKLSSRVAGGSGFFHRAESSVITISEYQATDTGLTPLGDITYRTSFVTVPTEGHMRANLTLGTYPSLNIYLPMLIAAENKDFALRISARGVLYSGGIYDCSTVRIDGAEYMCFSYPYIYSDGFDEEVVITLALGNVSEEVSIVPYKLALDSLEFATDEATVSATVAYLNYALYTCYDDGVDTLLGEYSSYIPQRVDYTPGSRIKSILSSVSLDTESNLLYLNLADRSASLTVSYTYGGREYTAVAEEGRAAIYWHRLDITSIQLSSGGESFTTNLAELYSLVSSSPSRSSETLSRYIGFINTICK